jgi:lipopolysaccharide biosynthesis glycosyltransferase
MTKMHIALGFDDGWWAPAYATMRSVCIATSRHRDVVFHLMHSGLSSEHRKALDAITAEYGAELVDHDLDKTDILRERIQDFPKFTGKRLNPIVYSRLFLHLLIPGERVIYLDSDLLIRVPIERLYDMDLEGKTLAAALCPHRYGFMTYSDRKPKPYYETHLPYFNAGVMLVDLRKFAEFDFSRTIDEVVGRDRMGELYFDQDLLNIAARGKWKELSYEWNLQNPVPAHESTDPLIVHYTGANKPWLMFATSAYKRDYRHVMTNAYYYAFMRERLKKRLLPKFLR